MLIRRITTAVRAMLRVTFVALMLLGARSAHGQIHYWPGQQNTLDAAGNADCSPPSGAAAACFATGRYAGSYAFEFGSNGQCAPSLVCSGAPLDFGTSDFMVSFAIRTSQTGTATLLTNRSQSCPNNDKFWRIVLSGGTLWPEFDGGTDGTNYAMWNATGVSIADDAWHDVTLVRKAGLPHLYIDGVERVLSLVSGVTVPPAADVSNGNPGLIGTSACTGLVTWFGLEVPFVGLLDEIKVFGN